MKTAKQISEELITTKEIPAKVRKQLEKIAKDSLLIDTLKTRNSDDLDFHEVSVWSVLDALYKAYSLDR